MTAPTEDALGPSIQQGDAPDSEQSNADVQPTPAVVTRTLFYDRARLSVGFSPDAPMNAPQPYPRWIYNGAFDTGTNSPIPMEEVKRRRAGGTIPPIVVFQARTRST